MIAVINKILDWFKSLFWKEGEFKCEKISDKYFLSYSTIILMTEMELTLVGLQYSGEIDSDNVNNWR